MEDWNGKETEFRFMDEKEEGAEGTREWVDGTRKRELNICGYGRTGKEENGRRRFMDMGGKGHRDAGSKRERER